MRIFKDWHVQWSKAGPLVVKEKPLFRALRIAPERRPDTTTDHAAAFGAGLVASMYETKVSIDRPHGEYAEHVDVVTPMPEIRGAHKMRIDGDGNTISNEIVVQGGYKLPIE